MSFRVRRKLKQFPGLTARWEETTSRPTPLLFSGRQVSEQPGGGGRPWAPRAPWGLPAHPPWHQAALSICTSEGSICKCHPRCSETIAALGRPASSCGNFTRLQTCLQTHRGFPSHHQCSVSLPQLPLRQEATVPSVSTSEPCLAVRSFPGEELGTWLKRPLNCTASFSVSRGPLPCSSHPFLPVPLWVEQGSLYPLCKRPPVFKDFRVCHS